MSFFDVQSDLSAIYKTLFDVINCGALQAMTTGNRMVLLRLPAGLRSAVVSSAAGLKAPEPAEGSKPRGNWRPRPTLLQTREARGERADISLMSPPSAPGGLTL